MAQKTFTIDSFPPGYYMSWFVTSQAAYSVNARLFDSARQYFNNTKMSTDIEPPLAQGAALNYPLMYPNPPAWTAALILTPLPPIPAL